MQVPRRGGKLLCESAPPEPNLLFITIRRGPVRGKGTGNGPRSRSLAPRGNSAERLNAKRIRRSSQEKQMASVEPLATHTKDRVYIPRHQRSRHPHHGNFPLYLQKKRRQYESLNAFWTFRPTKTEVHIKELGIHLWVHLVEGFATNLGSLLVVSGETLTSSCRLQTFKPDRTQSVGKYLAWLHDFSVAQPHRERQQALWSP